MTAEPATPSKGEAKPLFTDKEQKAMLAAWQCLKSGPPDIDMEKFAQVAGFNTVKTASNTWGVIKRKIFAGIEGSSGTPKTGGGKAGATPRSGSKRGARALDDDGTAADTPSKQRKGSNRKAVKEEEYDEDAAANDGESSAKKPRAQAKNGVKQEQVDEDDGGIDSEVTAAAKALVAANQAAEVDEDGAD